MPASRYTGAFPVVAVDAMTGYPLTGKDGDERVSTETQLKRGFRSLRQKSSEKHFDSLITQKGTESILAIVHLDGNNLSMRIRRLMEDEKLQGASYEACVERMRQISANIREKFQATYAAMERYLMDWVRSDANQVLDKRGNPRYLRKIIVAGDDVTFVCNAQVALSLVEFFVKDISGKTMFGEETGENLKEYGFSVCAGITYINSHFPFSTGYQVAEACCENAKHRAKTAEHMGSNDRVGSWVDFQICRNVQAGDLDLHREKNYVTGDGRRLLRRPYYISSGLPGEEMDEKNQAYDMGKFRRELHYFADGRKFPRSQVKELRNTYPYGVKEMDRLVVFLRSRGRRLPDGTDEAFDADGTAKWYDALEIMDYDTDMREGDGQDADQD
ncbi:MAG: hypothetical protein LUE31_06635 [Lachnospiraceae bacterium]|nr:hypothetical protein [Lachnospiraceae bacterium]